MSAVLELSGVGKSFTMHLQGGVRLPVVSDVAFTVRPGECVVLAGPSGSGKSSILKMIFGSYRCDAGRILVRQADTVTDVARAEPGRSSRCAGASSATSRNSSAPCHALPPSTSSPIRS